jgi:hypothetical protein
VREEGDYDNDNEEDVDVAIGMKAVADALVVVKDEDVVVNRMGYVVTEKYERSRSLLASSTSSSVVIP